MAFQELAGQIRALQLRMAGFLQQLRMAAPAGLVASYAGSTAPEGWLICDGRAVSRTDYPALFLAIGTTYGAGNGSSTFNLPQTPGRAIVGRDPNQSEFNALGKTGGSKTHTLTVAEMPSHTHRALRSSAVGTGSTRFPQGNAPTTVHTDMDIEATGGGGAHNNLQPYLTLNYIIKT